MRLTDILSPDCILTPLEARDKSEAIRQLVHVLYENGKCRDEEELLKAIFNREALRSTGIGQGLAVPHGKCPGVDSLIMSLGKPVEPIEFGSSDGIPARIIVLLASPPDQTGPHIQALARISRLMLTNNFREGLLQAASPHEVYCVVEKAEAL